MKPLFLALLCIAIQANAQNAHSSPRPGDTRRVLGIEFVWVPPGTFEMGSPHNEHGRSVCGNPEQQHTVRVPRGFWMGKYEVTQRQWVDLMGKNPSKYGNGDLQCPVECVSFHDCNAYLARLNEISGGRFRLPTEAEWEYACRAGTQTAYCYGNDHHQLDEYAWHATNGGLTTHPVGQKKPNAWGLYDMHGNVYEWCLDWYKDDYSGGTGENPPRWVYAKVCRGGAKGTHFAGCRSAYRGRNAPWEGQHNIGFRVLADELPQTREEHLSITSATPEQVQYPTRQSTQLPTTSGPVTITQGPREQDDRQPTLPTTARPNAANRTQATTTHSTELHAAVFADDTARILQLIQQGADINATDQYNRTPLHIAAMRGSAKTVKYLLKYGANPNLKDNTLNDGTMTHLTPHDWAESLGHMEVVDMLRASTPGKSH